MGNPGRGGQRRGGGSGAGCALCGGPKRHKQASAIVNACHLCTRGVCLKHSRYTEGKPICTACLKDQPAAVQRAAVRVG